MTSSHPLQPVAAGHPSLFFDPVDFPTDLNTASALGRQETDMGDSIEVPYRSVVYYASWSKYSRHFIEDLPLGSITHLIYAFLDVGEDGTVQFADIWSDIGCENVEAPLTPHSSFFQLFRAKRAFPHLKTMISIGGWSFREHFAKRLASGASQHRFVSSVASLLVKYGLDGVDIDWEYPETPQDNETMIAVLMKLRARLHTLHWQYGSPFLISVAAPGSLFYAGKMDIRSMDTFVDFWNLMTYSYSAPESWCPCVEPQSNLIPGRRLEEGNSVQQTVGAYMKQGVVSDKLVVGIPLYGRSFSGAIMRGSPYKGPGKFDNALYRDIILSGEELVVDRGNGDCYVVNYKENFIVTLDTVASVTEKCHYIKKYQLGGIMFWESSGDIRSSDEEFPEGSLIFTGANALGWLDKSHGFLSYDRSELDAGLRSLADVVENPKTSLQLVVGYKDSKDGMRESQSQQVQGGGRKRNAIRKIV